MATSNTEDYIRVSESGSVELFGSVLAIDMQTPEPCHKKNIPKNFKCKIKTWKKADAIFLTGYYFMVWIGKKYFKKFCFESFSIFFLQISDQLFLHPNHQTGTLKKCADKQKDNLIIRKAPH